MKKQIIHPTLISRVFITILDLACISFMFMPIGYIINKFFFNDYINQMSQAQSLANPQLNEFLSNNSKEIFMYGLVSGGLQIIFVLSYFIIFWYRYGKTPAKLLFNCRVVDCDSMKNPSVKQSIKRFAGTLLFIIGIWSIPFTKRKQALHDKIANTMVIKT